MSEKDIQRFLEYHGSALSKPIECNGRIILPSKAIYDACMAAGINPKVLLVKLQVEQSAVTKHKLSAHQLDWVLGFGATDSGRKPECKGFDNQIVRGARLFRRLWEMGRQNSYPYTFTGLNYNGKYGGEKQIQILNPATYALYRYTPHTYDTILGKKANGQWKGGGNYNFLIYYKQFSQEIRSLQASPMRTIQSKPVPAKAKLAA